MAQPADLSSSPTVAVSVSPTNPTLRDILGRRTGTTSMHIRQPKVLHPVDNEDLKLLLLENISPEAVAALRDQGWHVDHSSKAMSEDELVEKIHQYHAVGIRSKTRITERVLKAASKVTRPYPDLLRP
jgi:D-3-phosphoglycerate dehydrogenase / 2-oxoglutarate reductase